MNINLNRADFAMSVGSSAAFPRDPRPEVALSGRSNVGKSSLINTLLGRKSLARVSSTPGKTITVNYYDLDGKMYLVDLPGYGFAKRSEGHKKTFSSLTEDFFLKNPSADALCLVIQLVDVRTGPTEDDLLMIRFLMENEIPFTVVLTKTDKLSKNQLREATDALKYNYFDNLGIDPLPFSAVDKTGRDELFRRIMDAAFPKNR